MSLTLDERHMRHALSLAARGLGRTWPNPAVGCVILKDGRVVGRGWTQPGGRPHAEAMALAQAGDLARGGTAYVTLEPCSHHGKTPPCSEALIKAGLSRVVVALGDPDPRVNGKGFALLRSAGLSVSSGVLEADARRQQMGFLSKVTKGRPMLTLKLALSWDGRIATATGESQWITGPQARRRVHAMRANHDAVLVGGGTARADDPGLTVRGLGVSHQPVRVVMSRRLDLPLSGQLARTAQEVPVWILHGPDVSAELKSAWTGLGAELIEVGVLAGHLDPQAAFQALGARGLTRVFCEGGGALAASLLSAELVDRVALFTAGLAIGAEGLPGLGALGLNRLATAPRYLLESFEQIGPDALSLWSLAET
ncbi:bifunctional diaminohydroxyphosphoribosylaminopyrimidine deaminase/5-amino-6-(5-phosphoribosylamino)uracil reductase RibD [Celeribacter sp. HF31]|uniref:bifunctional diaminohydroxyphosphoribosylaminopyrimidine deaminase/5-amino-6-(5-phosphoribosylamino)uracil reductase RibD n=1 Tax=Celeribacter sp. HF31 TaxID=2721558 RepID=UPI00142FC00C|nr:bifunctional diaminohydroxyphosphoribosylaminopyrimidine deaminase/5-amino-6-(5-phosphoribosylamino)uracil reductase RibD [Celeribacter sp. HF31]NIY78237.1 bifunctional diaminohydroxyphosphoribosylaminopyrimidine deaminase/5-amino-6-(5-phosphoribosylamino)uracil reductase RibD [Celeribacter sp. HF31]